MVCTRCGNEIEGDAVTVMYGDPGFAGKPQTPFSLDAQCYEENRVVTVAEWVTNDQGDPVLREFEITRYVKA